MSDSDTVDRLSAHYGRILLDVALQFGEVLDLDRLLPIVLERVTELLKSDRALFALCDASGQVDRAVLHNLEWLGPGHPLPVSQSLIARVLQSGEPVVVADAASSEQYQQAHSVRLFGLRFMMGVPIPARGRYIGVLYVDSKASKVEDLVRETELLVALARLVGTATENARLFEEQRYRTQLLATLVHDFRTPLSVILANAEMIGQSEPVDSEAGEMATDIAASAQRMTNMVTNTLELCRSDANARPHEPRALDLTHAIPRHVRGIERVARPAGLEIALAIDPGLPPAHTVPDRLWIILDNLMFNALRHARSGTAIEVGVTLRDDPGPTSALLRPQEGVNLFGRLDPLRPTEEAKFLAVAVRNKGPTIAPSLLERLFQPYVHGSDPGRVAQGSTGLGLSISDQCVRHLGGSIWAESTDAGGTCFTFTVPTQVSLEEPLAANDTQPMDPLPGRS